MNKWIKLAAVGLFMGMQSSLFSAAFSIPSRLINIPVNNVFTPGQIDIGTATAFANKNSEFDLYANYAMSDRVIVGVTLVRSDTLVGHGQVRLWSNDFVSFSTGVLNISAEESVSSWENYDESERNTMSTYLVSSMQWFGVNYHVGVGSGRFRETVSKDKSRAIFEAKGVFWGIDAPLLWGRTMLEFDGRDFNLGYRKDITPFTEFNIAYTEAFLKERYNQNYNNAPVRTLTVALTIKNILNHETIVRQGDPKQEKLKRDKELEKVLKENQFMKDQINTVWSRLEELEAKEKRPPVAVTQNLVVTVHVSIKEPTSVSVGVAKPTAAQTALIPPVDDFQNVPVQEALPVEERVPTASPLIDLIVDEDSLKPEPKGLADRDTELGHEVLKLYDQSFVYFYQQDYLKAVDALNKAIRKQPKAPLLYIRLGTIYHELGLEKEALEEWHKALDLDPFNKDVQKLIKTYSN